MNTLPTISQRFSVEYQYRLLFTQGIFDSDNGLLDSLFLEYGGGEKVKAIFVVDKGVADHHPGLQNQIKAYAGKSKGIELTSIQVLPGGEEAKNDPVHVERVLKEIEARHICRHSFVVAVGGGGLIDMAGYAASLAHRGVRLLRIPTTVLAQNDAAVGVKNGVNYFGKKNFLGTFALPYAIINDSNFLSTLEDRDWISGMAEAMKVALLKDPEFFDFLEANAKTLRKRGSDEMNRLIHRCAEIHMEHISKGGDPFEQGSSRPLDFGHWSAHKMEQLTGYRMRHGEAVARGIALDVRYSCLMGWLDPEWMDRIHRVFTELGFDLTIPQGVSSVELLQGLIEFQEHLGGNLTIAMIRKPGEPFDVHEIDHDKMKQAIADQSDVPDTKISQNALS